MKRKEITMQREKSVVFRPDVYIYRTIHINDYTDEEIRSTWYNDREMDNIVSECVEIISSSKRPESPSNCLRGLECRTKEGQRRRASTRFCAIDAVLDEQDIQWEKEERNPDKIRSNYMTHTRKCQKKAFRMGLEDEKEAMAIHRESESSSITKPPMRSLKKLPSIYNFSTEKKLQNAKFRVSPKTTIKNMFNTSILHRPYSPVGRAA